jgi:hypothetical protein
LFSKCAPVADGSATVGVIDAPEGDYASMTARCSASITEGEGFVVVDLMFVAPYSAPDVQLATSLRSMRLPQDASISVARWSFIVTSDEVREVETVTGTSWTRPSSGFAVGIANTGQGWIANSEGACGGTFYVRGIVMISPCPP